MSSATIDNNACDDVKRHMSRELKTNLPRLVMRDDITVVEAARACVVCASVWVCLGVGAYMFIR